MVNYCWLYHFDMKRLNIINLHSEKTFIKLNIKVDRVPINKIEYADDTVMLTARISLKINKNN